MAAVCGKNRVVPQMIGVHGVTKGQNAVTGYRYICTQYFLDRKEIVAATAAVEAMHSSPDFFSTLRHEYIIKGEAAAAG